MRVSVALATHNGEAYLSGQLASILAQSRVPDEIVVSDDSSQDHTLQIVQATMSSAASGPDWILLENPAPLGVTANFQQALEAATGEILILSDQDDLWQPDRVAAVLGVFDADPTASLVVCDARLVDGNGVPLDETLFGALGLTDAERDALSGIGSFTALMRRNLVTGATAALRRELVDAALPFPTSWVHDEWLAVVASIHDGIRMAPTALIDYRQHGGNQIGVTRATLRDKIARISVGRTERNSRLLARAEDLAARYDARPELAAQLIDGIRAKLEHERVRSSLPSDRLARAIPVAREVVSGRYCTSGLGLQDVLRDLIQPAGS